MNDSNKVDVPMAAAKEPTTVFRTGTWRYERPVFVERIAPCSEACPLGQDIPTIMALEGRSAFEDAFHRIGLENPFPGICGQICFRPCERVCNRGRFDKAVSIRDLERFIAERAREKAFDPPGKTTGNGRKVAVIGGGPGGLSCAYFLGRLGYRVTVIENEPDHGIFKRVSSENPLNRELLRWEVDRVLSLVVDSQFNRTWGEEMLQELAGDFDAAYISPATREASSSRSPDLTQAAVYSSYDLFKGMKGKKPPGLSGKVVIIGRGQKAIETARSTKDLGAQPIVLFEGSREEVATETREVDLAEREGVDLRFQMGTFGLLEQSGRLRGVMATSLGERGEIHADQVIIALDIRDQGFRPATITASGLTVFNEDQISTLQGTPGAADQSRRIVRDMAAGKRAALALDISLRRDSFTRIQDVAVGKLGTLSMEAYLEGRYGSTERLKDQVVRLRDLNLDHFTESPRKKPPSRTGVFTELQAVLSAKRCFKCGICTFCSKCYDYCPDLSIEMDVREEYRAIDYDHCKGCGVCAQECPRGAIDWRKEY